MSNNLLDPELLKVHQMISSQTLKKDPDYLFYMGFGFPDLKNLRLTNEEKK